MTYKQLIAVSQKLHREIRIKADIRDEKKNKKLIGKCFKFKNSANSPNYSQDGSWWSYYRIDKADREGAYGLSFSKDDCGEIRIFPNCNLYMESAVTEITKKEFEQCFKEIVLELGKLA